MHLYLLKRQFFAAGRRAVTRAKRAPRPPRVRPSKRKAVLSLAPSVHSRIFAAWCAGETYPKIACYFNCAERTVGRTVNRYLNWRPV